jgi:WD40 repeat protein
MGCCVFADLNNIAVSRGGQVASTFVWSTEDPRSFPITLKGERGWQSVVRWSLDGKRVAIGAADGRLMVFNARAMTLEQVEFSYARMSTSPKVAARNNNLTPLCFLI